jgi:hypothetical protein
MKPRSVVTPDLGWRRAAVISAAYAVQMALTWSILRDATVATRPRSILVRTLQVAALIAANTLQTGLTWWLYRAATCQHRTVDDLAAQQRSGG